MDTPERIESLEQEIGQLRRQLIDAQQMTAIGELVSTTTHEFNNVLTTIINYARMGIRHRDDATRDKALQKILAAGERAAKITNTVLGMARNRSNQLESCDLRPMIQETLTLLEREMNKYRIAVDCDLQEVPQATANANQIQQVLLNLMINARQAMPDGGTLLIRLSHDAKASTVDLCVRDSGCGIPQQQLPRIFDSFFTTKEGPDQSGKGGTGLGLSACRTIVEQHHGRIRVESTVGKGTAFTIKLPVAPTETPSVPLSPTTTSDSEPIMSPSASGR